jgi:ssDNA-binding replication factor A large subunit
LTTCKQCGEECELVVQSDSCEGEPINIVTSDCCNADVDATEQEIMDAIISASGGDE